MIHEQTINGKIFHEIKNNDSVNFTIYDSVESLHNNKPFFATRYDRNKFIGLKLNEIRKQLDQQTFK